MAVCTPGRLKDLLNKKKMNLDICRCVRATWVDGRAFMGGLRAPAVAICGVERGTHSLRSQQWRCRWEGALLPVSTWLAAGSPPLPACGWLHGWLTCAPPTTGTSAWTRLIA